MAHMDVSSDMDGPLVSWRVSADPFLKYILGKDSKKGMTAIGQLGKGSLSGMRVSLNRQANSNVGRWLVLDSSLRRYACAN